MPRAVTAAIADWRRQRRNAGLRAVLVAVMAVGAAARAAAASPPDAYEAGPCAGAASSARLAPQGEPGTPLLVNGRVVEADGSTPAAGVIVYAYQTDASGVYNPRRGEPPRLRGWARADADGRFTLHTIRPGPYPGGRVPAHVHFQFWGRGHEPRTGVDLLFEDDPSVGAAQRADSRARGTFAFVHAPTRRPDGTLEVTQVFRLAATGDTFDANRLHGLDACRDKSE